jgi:hypothetical protein
MKRHVIFFILIAVGFNYFGQELKKKPSKIKHEINFILQDFLMKNNYFYNDLYDYDYRYFGSNNIYNTNYAKAGIGYRLHFGKYAIRTRLLMSSNNSKSENVDKNKVESEFLELEANLGVERHLDLGKAQLFYGLDFGFKKGKNNYKFTNYVRENNNYETNTKGSSFVISPLAGIKYQFHPSFSISTELRFNLEKYYYEYETIFGDKDMEKQMQKTEGLKTKIGPIGFLSFNFHF